MSTKKNDSAILKLKEGVQLKKAELNKAQRFLPITNCSLRLEGTTYNIQVSDKETLVKLIVVLNAYKVSAVQVGLLREYVLSGFPVEDWLIDLKAKLAYLNRKDEEKKLHLMEAKLQQLLSNEKQVELEVNDLAKLLDDM